MFCYYNIIYVQLNKFDFEYLNSKPERRKIQISINLTFDYDIILKTGEKILVNLRTKKATASVPLFSVNIFITLERKYCNVKQ
ncbi:UNVERIFIED_CONTAM: hypothetical protein RMT77_018105 [Armadillidium vulgare]